jgi:hypothetical protein
MFSQKLTSFKNFISNMFDALTTDKLISRIREGNQDLEVINEYVS